MPLLEWQTLGQPRKRVVSSYVGNVQGALLEHNSRLTYDFHRNEWAPVAGTDIAHLGMQDAPLYSIRTDGGKTWIIVTRYLGRDMRYLSRLRRGIHRLVRGTRIRAVECRGLSILSDDGYYGTFEIGTDYSAALVWKDTLFVNDAGRLLVAPMPRRPTFGCNQIPGRVLIDQGDYVYTALPLNGALYLGGGGHRRIARDSSCPPIYVASGSSYRVVELSDCRARSVNEIYGMAPYEGALYVGTFPDGFLRRVGPGQESASVVRIPAVGDSAGRYFESQAVAATSGMLMVGLFPWGEVITVRGDSQRVQRLFRAPHRRKDSHQPYAEEAGRRQCVTPGNAPDCVPLPRPEFWGQRVTSLAVLDGRVCAGTGNTFSIPYDSAVHTMLTSELAQEYGAVHCALLPNQTLAPPPRAGAKVSLVVTRTQLAILYDGAVVAARTHRLSAAQLASLGKQ